MNTKTQTPFVPFLLWGIDPENILNPVDESGAYPSKAARVVFCHESYPVTVSLEGGEENPAIGRIKYFTEALANSIFVGKSYTNKYKRAVVWDFGDGTTVKGASATHTFTRPGRYTVSCLFMTSEKHAHQNEYSVEVIVKELIPTKLSPLEKNLNINYPCYCGKITRLNTIEAQFSNGWEGERKVLCERVYKDGEKEETPFSKVTDPLKERYWAIFTRREGKLVPVEDGVFSTEKDLQTIYGNFFWDATSGQVRVNLSAVMDEGELDPNDKRLKIYTIDPDSPSQTQRWGTRKITAFGAIGNIPEG